MNHKYTFTIFTATYNAENIIERLFESLQKQTFKDFEWVLIDDCSTDRTREIIKSIIPLANFPVKYIENETNQMICKNHEIALDNSEGKFWIKLSHDDMLVENALENFLISWNHFSEKEIEDNKLIGVILHCVDKNGELEGDEFPSDFWISNDFEMRFDKKIKGEKSSATLTEYVRKYPFYHPEVDTYVPEDLHFYTLSNTYNYIYHNLAGRVHIVNDGLHEHLEAKMSSGRKYVNGFAYYFENLINKFENKIWKYSKKHYFIYMTNFVRYSRYNNKTYNYIFKKIKHHKWLFIFAVLLGNVNELVKYKKLL